MQEQLSDLQLKLSKEEEERTSVAKLNKELDKVTQKYSLQLISPRTIFYDFPTLTFAFLDPNS